MPHVRGLHTHDCSGRDLARGRDRTYLPIVETCPDLCQLEVRRFAAGEGSRSLVWKEAGAFLSAAWYRGIPDPRLPFQPALHVSPHEPCEADSAVRTYLYKIISDRGGAPCAPPPAPSESEPGAAHLLTLAICKPAIRRTAAPGDRIVGISSRALERRQGYAPASVIYAGTVAEAVPARVYYAPDSPFRSRPDCVYRWEAANDTFVHAGASGLHAHPEHMRKDLGSRFDDFRNGRVLLLSDFRYFGAAARTVPESLPRLHRIVAALGQGHRVFEHGDDPAMDAELETLFRQLRRRRGTASPSIVDADTYDHVLSREGQREIREQRTRYPERTAAATAPRTEEPCRFMNTSARPAIAARKKSRSSPTPN